MPRDTVGVFCVSAKYKRWMVGVQGMMREISLSKKRRLWNASVTVSKGKLYLVGFLCSKLDVGGVHVAVTDSTHFH